MQNRGGLPPYFISTIIIEKGKKNSNRKIDNRKINNKKIEKSRENPQKFS